MTVTCDLKSDLRMNQESHDFSRAECQEEMTVYKPGTTYPDTKAMAEKTKEHLASGTPVICEAAFLNYNNYCAADILRKTDAGYDMYEVKNSPEVDDQYIKDAAFQYYIISKCHTKIDQIYIVIHGQDEENPFVPVNVTEKAKELYNWIDSNIWRLNSIQKGSEEYQIDPGEQCREPYECWYYGYCHPETVEENKENEQTKLI